MYCVGMCLIHPVRRPIIIVNFINVEQPLSMPQKFKKITMNFCYDRQQNGRVSQKKFKSSFLAGTLIIIAYLL
jgi:hypothetical protein